MCPACQAECRADSKFCASCGTSLTQQAAASAGDRRIVTVLFTDVSGFTAMSEKLDPGAVTAIVNDFFEVLTEPIYRFGGVVDKYIGDAIMALFGAPIAHEDDPERALHAAHAMQGVAKEFADRLEAKTGIRLKVRIGLNTGLVVTGEVGGEHKKGYTVLGDTVNLAQAMESLARPGGVLVTHETYRLAVHAFEFLARDPVAVRGRPQPIPVYEVVGPRHERVEPQRERRFVNRRRELESMAQAWFRTVEGHPQLVIVNGEAGIGKSHLVAHFVQHHCQPAPMLFRARCQSYTSGQSFGVLTGMLHYWLDAPPSLGGADLKRRLDEQCAVHAEDGRLSELLGYLLGIETTDPELGSLTPEQRRNAALREFNALLLKLGAASPVMVSIEDLQWADEASIEWLASFLDLLSTQRTPTRILVLCQHRPEAKPIGGDRLKIDRTVIQLRALQTSDCMDIASAHLRTEVEPDSPLGKLLVQVVERADGNPFYLNELLSSLVDGKQLIPEPDGGWQVADSASGLKLPTTIQGAVAARLDRLNPEQRSVIQVGAVLGRIFAPALIQRLAPVPERDQALRELCGSGFLYPNSQGDYAFTQPLIQEVAYNSLLMSSRKELHGRVGKALEAEFADHLDEHVHLLAHHFDLAEQPEPALKYLTLSAKRSFDFYDLARARSDAERALTLSEQVPGAARWEILHLLAQILVTQSQYDEAIAITEKALTCTPNARAQAKILQQQGSTYEFKGEYQAALDVLLRVPEILPPDAVQEHAAVLARIGYMRLRLGQHDDCVRMCTRSLEMLAGMDAPRDQSYAHSVLGISYYRRGDTERAFHHTQQALELRAASHNLSGLANCYNTLAMIATDQGDWAKADDYYRRALAAYERIGDSWYISLVRNNLGELLMNQGELEEAEESLRKALELKQAIGDQQGIGIAMFNIGAVYWHRGVGEEALAFMGRALAIFQEIQSREFFPEVLVTIAQVWADLKRPEEARDFLRQASESASEVGDDATAAVIPRIESQLHLQDGDLEGAKQEADRAIALIQDQDSPLNFGRAQAQLYRVLRAMGDRPGAAEALHMAQDSFQKLGALVELAKLSALPVSPGPAV